MAVAMRSREELFRDRARRLWERYRFTAEAWMAQYAVQGGRCMYCDQRGGDLYARGRSARELEPLVYDHEHDPPYRFRGLGHDRCNGHAGRVERRLKDPPAWRPGGVAHRVPVTQALALERAAEVDRARKARKRAGLPSRAAERAAARGERQTYRYPIPDAGAGGTRRGGTRPRVDLVAAALAEAEEAAATRAAGRGGVPVRRVPRTAAP